MNAFMTNEHTQNEESREKKHIFKIIVYVQAETVCVHENDSNDGWREKKYDFFFVKKMLVYARSVCFMESE